MFFIVDVWCFVAPNVFVAVFYIEIEGFRFVAVAGFLRYKPKYFEMKWCSCYHAYYYENKYVIYKAHDFDMNKNCFIPNIIFWYENMYVVCITNTPFLIAPITQANIDQKGKTTYG